jgi:subtilase family serine protease
MKPLVLSALLAAASMAYAAQPLNRITAHVDLTQVRALPNHHPLWANAGNDAGLTPADLPLDQMTLVLSRSDEQEAAFEQLLADQQNPASADYHRWLTPVEVGERFGLTAQDIDTLSGWLQSEGLHVNWVSPSRTFIGFGGTAANLGRAFQTELHYYNVNGVKRMSVASDPMIPQALAPAIKAIRGLYTLEEQPQHHAAAAQSASPQMTISSAIHFMAPADFATIYDLPQGSTGAGQTIGIVGRAHTNFADFDSFRQRTLTNFSNPTEFVPTAFGGIDPGPALTTPPAAGVSVEDQLEATLDVQRAGSVAAGANLLLVVASSSSGNIGADVQYLVQTSPVPAQVMTISFGACELSSGASGVNYWDSLFQQAAAEGISVFVSSGDAGASGCDSNFSTPPAAPKANSPNYICSSSYATCVGGTEFNDTNNPTSYWNSSNASNLSSALSYIPEGGWNEPLNSSSLPEAASSGGGVSTVIATPSWQTGTGVPAARSGRYTPDISFSASCRDGYFGCFAAGGASCVTGSSGYTFEYFCGTSAAAPAMAGATALLDEKFGRGLGNLNPALYQMAASAPTAFHDVTVASSGVASCAVNTPSMCNNSIPSSTGLSGGQAGFLVTAGYDEVTGLGSLDLQNFFNSYIATPTTAPFTVGNASLTLTAGATTGNTATITVTPIGSFTGSVALTAVLTTSPANGTYPPTFSFGTTSPVSITGGGNGAAQLTITTTASQTQQCTADNPMPRGMPWYAEGGTALALVLLFGIPGRRRRVRNLLGMAALAVALVSGMASCGGGASGTKVCSTTVLPGTTPGLYIVTVTGTSGATQATGAVSLTVQ